MTARVYPDVNTTSASNGPANEAVHRKGHDVNSVDQVSSVVLLGLAIVGAVTVDLVLALVI